MITVVDRAKGRRSGVPSERVHAQVWTIENGLAVHIEILDDRAAALEAVGLAG